MATKNFIKNLLEKLEGIHSIESVMKLLNINRKSAIVYISLLKKEGYVKTRLIQNKKRIYNISIQNKQGGKSYYDIINENSPIKIAEPQIYKIYGREPSLEETLVFAIKTEKIRVILAALVLFKKINKWTLLGYLARKNNIGRKVGALYDLARKIMRTRRMSEQLTNSILPKKNDDYIYVINGLSSKDFKDIEQKWKVYIPFNKEDVVIYSK